ncbi:Glutamate--tRNA ligase 1 [Rubripirellula lacrimiformis]|uniref:Glutamate--tRNA ligase 1 n=1 Tax=Rubripirellula lacrimiformis TaxID=1930273 RepID=A0A517N6Z4_9BACT|nr:tRNA glutamyl-Q(34) synthetase GluQRS [Rubripirellula lacrimiformis]QDT02916.1 Glutamate--tRNA ligase 1 [Rubripirellula lacrimiformis]
MMKSRLAPSPTGAQHLGNARTYLLAHWSAMASGAGMILRIEDVDSPRIKPWATQQAIDDLRWLGIRWDEGPDVGGPHGPYVQTQRIDLYRDALDRLIQADRVYPCTCTRKDIEESGSAPHFEHEGPIYPGTCAGWQRGDEVPPPDTFCWRFRAGTQTVAFDDLVMGSQACVPATDLGDFAITQKNGAPSYQLAVVVDDAAMGVTEAVRGNDLIASTFRQLEIYRVLQHSPPHFAHVPLVRGPDGRRLAKRHGDTRLSHFRELGIAPKRIIDWAIETTGIADPTGDFQWSALNRDDVVVDSEWLAAGG